MLRRPLFFKKSKNEAWAAQRVSKLGKYVTLKDIAKATGLTMASVSRALNDMPEISEETKNHVWEVAASMGYRPNAFASSLRTGKSKFVGIVIPQNTNPYFAGIIADIMAVVIANGYMPLIFNTLESRRIEADAVSAMLAFRVAGILAIPVDLKNFLNLPVPVITMARQFSESEMEKFDYVINDERGMEISVRYLAERYRKIYYFNGPKDFRAGEVRRKAFEAALRQVGREYSEDIVINCEGNDMNSGYAAAKVLLSTAPTPYAIQCISDHVAMGVIQAIRESYMCVPEDIAVIGHDDIQYCDYLPIPLSSIRLSREVGKVAATFFFEKLKDKTAKMKIVVEPKLIIRKSAQW